MKIFNVFYENNVKGNSERRIHGWFNKEDAIEDVKKLICNHDFKKVRTSGYSYCVQWNDKKIKNWGYAYIFEGQIQ